VIGMPGPSLALIGLLSGIGRELPEWVDRWALVAVLWGVFALVGLWWLWQRTRAARPGPDPRPTREQRPPRDMPHPYDVRPRSVALRLAAVVVAGLIGLALVTVGVAGERVDAAAAELGPVVIGVALVIALTAVWWRRSTR
jgi:hypothetical protein